MYISIYNYIYSQDSYTLLYMYSYQVYTGKKTIYILMYILMVPYCTVLNEYIRYGIYIVY